MRLVVTAIALAALLVPAVAQEKKHAHPAAAETKHAHPDSLHEIMEELHGEFLRLTDALLLEDFVGMKRSADAIKAHPMPQAVLDDVKKKLGRGYDGFVKRDEVVHKAAAQLAERAAKNDAAGAAQAYSRLARGCVACHKQYRPSLKTQH